MERSATKQNRAFSLIEVLLAASIFAFAVAILIGAIIYSQDSTNLAGNHAKAVFLAEEGLEAIREMRNSSYVNLVPGTYGLAISGGVWVFSGTQDITDGFTRQIILSTVNSTTTQAISQVSWQQNQQRNGLVSLTTYLTNWQR